MLTENELLNIWEQIGHKNLWIKEAVDPPFDKTMLTHCNDLETLKSQFKKCNWCLGQGFYFRNICFINQLDGGDEWLTIRDDLAFESITFEPIIKRGEFIPFLNRLLTAKTEDLKNLSY